MFEFRKDCYYVGFWFVGGRDRDWLACVYREQGEANWILVHRFRYHNDESKDPFDGKDKKNFYSGSVHGSKKSEEQIVDDMGRIATVVGAGFSAKPQFVPVRGDGDKALFDLAMQPWAHVKMVEPPAEKES